MFIGLEDDKVFFPIKPTGGGGMAALSSQTGGVTDMLDRIGPPFATAAADWAAKSCACFCWARAACTVSTVELTSGLSDGAVLGC